MRADSGARSHPSCFPALSPRIAQEGELEGEGEAAACAATTRRGYPRGSDHHRLPYAPVCRMAEAVPYSLIIPVMLSTKKSLMPSVTRTPSFDRAFSYRMQICTRLHRGGLPLEPSCRFVGLIRPGLLLVEAALKARGDGQLR